MLLCAEAREQRHLLRTGHLWSDAQKTFGSFPSPLPVGQHWWQCSESTPKTLCDWPQRQPQILFENEIPKRLIFICSSCLTAQVRPHFLREQYAGFPHQSESSSCLPLILHLSVNVVAEVLLSPPLQGAEASGLDWVTTLPYLRPRGCGPGPSSRHWPRLPPRTRCPQAGWLQSAEAWHPAHCSPLWLCLGFEIPLPLCFHTFCWDGGRLLHFLFLLLYLLGLQRGHACHAGNSLPGAATQRPGCEGQVKAMQGKMPCPNEFMQADSSPSTWESPCPTTWILTWGYAEKPLTGGCKCSGSCISSTVQPGWETLEPDLSWHRKSKVPLNQVYIRLSSLQLFLKNTHDPAAVPRLCLYPFVG